MNEFAPFLPKNTTFVVKNIAPSRKVLRIFQFPIPYNTTRDLLRCRGVSEADIRASLLKGELNIKISAGELTIVQSDIDLLQFNAEQKLFLESNGVTIGTSIGSTQMPDFDLAIDPVFPSHTYTKTHDVNDNVIQEQWKRNSDNSLIKQIDYTYTTGSVTQEIRRIYNTTGSTIIGQITIVYNYDINNQFTSYTVTRNI